MELSILEPPLLLLGWRMFPETELSPVLVTFEFLLTTLLLCEEGLLRTLLSTPSTRAVKVSLLEEEELFWRTAPPLPF